MSCEGIERIKLWWKIDSKKVNPFHLSSAEHTLKIGVMNFTGLDIFTFIVKP